jgi:hypothetical protein
MFNINKLARSLLGEESEVVLKDIGKAIKPAAKLGGHIGKDYLKQEAKEWWESQQSQEAQSYTPPQQEHWGQAGMDANWVYYRSNYGRKIAKNRYTGQEFLL